MPTDPLAPFLDPPALDPPDLIDDLPPFEQSAYEMQSALSAIGNELARLEAARLALRDNFFPVTADALLDRFEDLFGLPPDLPDFTLDQRRALIEAFARRLSGQGTEREWEDNITAVIGSGWSYDTPSPYVINILLPFSPAVPPPVGLAIAVATGGTLTGTYYYAVTAVTGFGETLVGTSMVSGAMVSKKATLTWTAQGSPTIGYNVYRGTSPSALYQMARVSTATFVDTGAVTPGVQLAPAADTSASSLEGLAWSNVRDVTPAHLEVNRGYVGGFLVGISRLGEDVL